MHVFSERKLDSFITNKTSVLEADSDVMNNNSHCKQAIDSVRTDVSVVDSDMLNCSDSGVSFGNSSETDKESCSASSQDTVTSLDSFPVDKNMTLVYHSPSKDGIKNDISRFPGEDVNSFIYRTGDSNSGVYKCNKVTLNRTADQVFSDNGTNNATNLRPCEKLTCSKENILVTGHVGKSAEGTESEPDKNLHLSSNDYKSSRLKAEYSSCVENTRSCETDIVETEGDCSIIQHEIVSKKILCTVFTHTIWDILTP